MPSDRYKTGEHGCSEIKNYAAIPRIEGGLGLTDITANLPGLILIGRRKDIDESTKERRRQMANDLRIRIHSYDWLFSQGGLFWELQLRKENPEVQD
ncbi:MAG TPA: hypothetical protein VEW46_11350 [Pyrinomonadaceae bacterium]|nr:hypothetical protein [Pyrinomonadaceae bacterium]